MDIEIRYFDDCPNWRATRELIIAVLADVGIDAEVSLTLVETPEEAERLSFRGSPTVVIDGIDPWSHPDAPIGLSCRVYRTESGLAGLPSEVQLRDALAQAAN